MRHFCSSSPSALGKLGCLLILLIKAENSIAQIPGHFSVQLTAGAAFPMGKFATAGFPTYPTSEADGSALTGPLAKLRLSYQLNRSVGLALSIEWQQNSRDNDVVVDTLKARFPGHDYYRVHSDPWVLWNGMLGAFFLCR